MTKHITIKPGRKEWLAMIAGALLYGGMSWLTNIFPLNVAGGVDIRPGVAVPIFFGFAFGPLVGFVVGALGNFFGDWWSGYIVYPPDPATGNLVIDVIQSTYLNWQVGNGLMGLVAGVLPLFNHRYRTLTDQLRAAFFIFLGVVLGMGFASFTDIPLDHLGLKFVWSQEFLPAVRGNLINALLLVPILLFNYERLDLRSFAWLRSGLLQRLLLVILISAALPVALLGFFLTQQTTGVEISSTELTIKLSFTILLTLVFTIANSALVAQSISRPLLRLAEAARLMEAGELSAEQATELETAEGHDEIGHLCRVFGQMAREVISREQELRRQVEELRIEIDVVRQQQQVAEITETDYFRSLQQKARQMRAQMSEEDDETTE